MILKNDLVKLRAIEPADIDLLYEWENNSEIWNVSNTIAPFSKYVLDKYLENSHLDIFALREIRLVIEENNQSKAVGCVDLFDFEPIHLRAGVGILINNREDRKKGFANSAMKLLIEYSKNTLFLHQLFCNISADNTASLSLFQNLGFEISGTKKDWNNIGTEFKDEYFLQKIL